MIAATATRAAGQEQRARAELCPAARRRSRRCRFRRPEAKVVLVHVQVAVEPEELGVLAEEAPPVRIRRERFETLVLERFQLLRPDPRRRLDVRQLELSVVARLPQAAADLEHFRPPSRRSVPFSQAELYPF